ncbi:uncharacterized protein LOC128965179 [Oppia nitens]|uniref:uncharacterized protein LOC128965179 n=1 Tax=Oppia nitens TaxID=1686743 RepID=UPI0023DABEBC|nr:uncharacterized protein LOC128965179 [Oppia nitens]
MYHDYASALGYRCRQYNNNNNDQHNKTPVQLIFSLPFVSIKSIFFYNYLNGIFIVIVPVYLLFIGALFWSALQLVYRHYSRASLITLWSTLTFVLANLLMLVQLYLLNWFNWFPVYIYRYLILVLHNWAQLLMVVSIDARDDPRKLPVLVQMLIQWAPGIVNL